MKKIAFITFLYLCQSSQAFDLTSVFGFGPPLVDTLFNDVGVMRHYCEGSTLPSLSQMESELLEKEFLPRVAFDHSLQVRILDESEYLLDLFSTITARDGSFVGSKCRGVLCLAKEKSSTIIRDMYYASKFGLNLRVSWEDKIRRENLELLNRALMLFPKHIWSMKLGEISKVQESSENYMGRADILAMVDPTTRVLTIYPPFNNGYTSSARKVAALFHELSHLVDLRLGHLSEKKDWMELSRWEEGFGNKWKARKKNVFVSRYAETNASEDFAESMVAYRFTPDALKKRSPEKYQFLKDVIFQGLEYTSAADCTKKAVFEQFIQGTQSLEEIQTEYSYQCDFSTYGALDRDEDEKSACYRFYQDKKKHLDLGGYFNLGSYSSLRESLALEKDFPLKVEP